MTESVGQVLRLEERKKLTVSGVDQVIRFEDNLVVLATNLGQLHIHGQELQLKNLSLEGGQAAVEGEISALIFQQVRERGIFGRLLP